MAAAMTNSAPTYGGGRRRKSRGQAAPARASAEAAEAEDELSGDAVAGLLAKRWDLPVSHEVTLGGHRSVSHRGRPAEPCSRVAGLQGSGSAQPQIFTRDGAQLLRFNRGDPYVTDMARTTGHVTIVTGGQWHPHEDATGLRDFLLCDHTIRVRDKGARKCAATAVAYSPDGRRVCCGAADGSLQIFQLKGRAHNYLRPDACLRLAHTPGTDVAGAVISCVSFSPDGNQVATPRTTAVKVFDVRKLAKGPLCAFPGVEARGSRRTWPGGPTAPCSARRGARTGGRGSLRFFSVGGPAHEVHREAGGYRPLVSLGVGDVGASCVCVLWHDRIKHVLAGGTDGATRALYDPELSQKGALMSVRRNHAPRHVATDSAHVDASSIVNPNALPMFRDDLCDDGAFKKKGQYSKMRKDPIKSKLPDGPLDSGQQGRNEGARSTFCQYYIERNLPDSIRNSDPREELLKYADKEPIFRTEATFYTGADGQRTDMADSTLEAAEVDFVEDQKKLISARSFSASAKDAAKKKTT
ncbi:nucleotide binding protein [Aureococcus anophagefferens]|nr:nucleotide binding protein [Aureococcus anophagefferens]